ncbi:unnamed protein product [Symbiodinium sp. CCMP2592]|nr:unnamed protein product [Symbiodinium sp. CCMP2592]
MDITAEQLLIDVASLSDLTEEEVRQTGVQNSLVALHLAGNVPDDRPDLQRLAQGLSMIRPSAGPPMANVPTTGPADGTEETAPSSAGMLGVLPGANAANEPNDSVLEAPAPSGPNAAANAVPREARHLMNEVLVPHRLSRHGPVNALRWTAELSSPECGMSLTFFITTVVENDRQRAAERANDLADRMLRAQVNLAESGGTTAYRFDHPDRHVEWRSPHYAKENATDALVNVDDWLAMGLYTNGVLDLAKFPCHQLNGSYNALSALRKTVQWANQGVFEESGNGEPIAFVVFRRTKTAAMRRWVAGGPNGNARVKLANYFNRQFTDHISAFEWDGDGPDNWKWTMEPLSHASAGIVRVPMTIMEWGMLATNRGDSLLEWRLMGHTMDEIYENDGNEAQTAWNAPKAKANDQTVGTALAQTASALDPGSEIVLRKNAKGTVK